jgi:peroxidase
MASSSSRAAAALVLAISFAAALISSATVTVNEPIADGLSWSFYDASCPSVEGTVRWHVTEALRRDIGIAAGLIRIFFHDCFPQVAIGLVRCSWSCIYMYDGHYCHAANI